MAKYIQLKKTDINRIAAEYKISPLESSYIDGGANNTSFLLKTSDRRYVLTIFDEKTWEESLLFGKTLLWLADYQFFTTWVVKAQNGDILTNYNDKPVMLKTYIEGQVHDVLDNNMLFQTGAALGQLHEIPLPPFFAQKEKYDWKLCPNLVGKEIDSEYENWLRGQLKEIEAGIPEGLPTGFIHSDLFADNVLFENKQFKAIIDMENTSIHYKSYDLGMAIVGLCQSDKGLSQEKIKAVVNGYQQVRSLEGVEKKVLKLFVKAAAITTSCWRLRQYRIRKKIPERAEKHREMMALAKAVDRITDAEFLKLLS